MCRTNKDNELEITKTMSSKKIKTLISIVYGNFFLGCGYALMAPFFPAEAEKKNASPSEYGLVFGANQIVMAVASLFYGKLLALVSVFSLVIALSWSPSFFAYSVACYAIPILTPGFMLKSGMIVSGLCSILFGFLEYVSSGPLFIWLACIIRIVDGLGAAAFLTASYTTLGCEMPDIIGRAMAITETSYALGLTGGPVLGGFFFNIGGFTLPFLVIGAFLFIGTAVNIFLYTNKDYDIPPRENRAKLLSDVDFLIDVVEVLTCFLLISFNDASLEPHIRQFSLTPSTLGLIFFISGLTDAVSSFGWGFLAEKMANAQYLTILGSISMIISFLIVGPIPFLNISPSLPIVILAQFLLGLGMASEIICSFTHSLRHLSDKGFPNDVTTYSLVSCVLFSVACFGSFVGSSLGGFFIDNFGYIKTVEIFVGVKTSVALLSASRLIFLFLKKKNFSKT